MRSTLGIFAFVVTTAATAVAGPPCPRCVDQWKGEVEADGRERHQVFVDAGQSFRVTLSPDDANANLVVAFDGHWPTDDIACRSAVGGTHDDSCTFRAKGAAPVYLFVLGGERATGYDLRVEPAGLKR